MKKSEKQSSYKIIPLSFLIGFTFFLFYISFSSNVGCGSAKESPFIGSTDMVSVDMMKDDFQYVVHKLKNVHPATIEGFTAEQEKIIAGIEEEIKSPQTKEKFFFLVNQLFHSFHDAHTTLWLDFSKGINLPLIWLKQGLYVKHNTDTLKQGDLILKIGGLNIAGLAQQLLQILWTENKHLLRLEGTWMLTARPYLKWLGLLKQDFVEVTFKRGIVVSKVKLPIISLQRPENEKEPFLSYSIDKNHKMAVLTLNSCRYNSKYRKNIRSFFKEVYTHKVKQVVLDLRRNPGGDSRVIDTFLRYINIDKLKTYGSKVRFSQEARKKTGIRESESHEFPRSEKTNDMINQQELLFSGKIYVLTSPNTFSSANMFAAVLQDNKIGIIVGEPTGNKPSCYGHPLPFQMPNTGINFKISHKQFFRPEAALDSLDAVYPDVEIYREIEDIINKTDQQMEVIIQWISLP